MELKGLMSLSDMHSVFSVDTADLQKEFTALMKHGSGISTPIIPSKYPKGYNWALRGHSHSFSDHESPGCSMRTQSEVDVDHIKVKRLDFAGGKALWKFSKNKRKWIKFSYNSVKKEISIAVDCNTKVKLRGIVIEEYERYLARLVCT